MGDRLRDPVLVPDDVDDDDDDTTPSTNDNPPGGEPDPFHEVEGVTRHWVVNALTTRANWAYDTRNDFLLPTRGISHHLSMEATLPGSDLEYWRLSYDFEHYWPIAPWLVMKSAVSLGYGDSYGKTHDAVCSDVVATSDGVNFRTIPGTEDHCGLPFFKNFYAGGPGSVRGFTTNTLGPTSQFGGFSRRQPLGGAVKTTGTFEFYFPRLLGSGIGQGSRVSAFVDYGYVFARPGDFALREFRISTGLALQWQSPMGPISISYAFPLQHDRNDDVEQLQFTFGNQQ
jgi:outer membrane protein insertion porin family